MLAGKVWQTFFKHFLNPSKKVKFSVFKNIQKSKHKGKKQIDEKCFKNINIHTSPTQAVFNEPLR